MTDTQRDAKEEVGIGLGKIEYKGEVFAGLKKELVSS